MHNPVYVQRLKRPTPCGNLNPFIFGGGGSGLDKETLTILSEFFTFDYMGDSNFEFGAPQRCLHAMLELGRAGKLGRYELEITAKMSSFVPEALLPENAAIHEVMFRKPGTVTGTVHLICEPAELDEIGAWLRSQADGTGKKLKHPLGLGEALEVEANLDRATHLNRVTCAWIDFTSYTMGGVGANNWFATVVPSVADAFAANFMKEE